MALAGGRFARVPILNGTNHDEERLFLVLGAFLRLPGLTVSGGTYVVLPEPITPDSYRRVIKFVLSVTDARAAAIAAEYPLNAYASPDLAFSALVGDANFACTALQMDGGCLAGRRPSLMSSTTTRRLGATRPSIRLWRRTYPNSRTCSICRTRRFRCRSASTKRRWAATMRTAWANFATSGDPSSASVPWPSFDVAHVMSLVPPEPQVETDFASRHHCSFWAAR